MKTSSKDVYYNNVPNPTMIHPLSSEHIRTLVKHEFHLKEFLFECYLSSKNHAEVMKQNIKTALEIAQLNVPLWVATNGGLLIIDANYTPTFEINFLR